jgi:hypothetical protein
MGNKILYLSNQLQIKNFYDHPKKGILVFSPF